MYSKQHLPYPSDNPKVTINKQKSGSYVYYEVGRIYKPETQHTTPKRVCIGKLDSNDVAYIFPNDKYFYYFPSIPSVEEDECEVQEPVNDDDQEDTDEEYLMKMQEPIRSSTLSIGGFIAIRKIVEQLKLDSYLQEAIRDSKICGIFLDFAAYEILEQLNVAQHFPTYAFRHPLFTPSMTIYSDSTLGKAFNALTSDQRQTFLNLWNAERNKRERIYVSYDSTNRHTKAGEIEEAEYGKAKDGIQEPIINQGMAYDSTNREPLFYESYPGSIVDISMLQFMIDESLGYGYENIGFILDRGYFARDNLFYIDDHDYSFVIMAKGSAKFIHSLVEEAMGTFEVERENLIQKFMVYGTTIHRKIFPGDERDKIRYVHVYYNEFVAACQRDKLEKKIYKWQEQLRKRLGKKASPNSLSGYKNYFSLEFKDGKLESFHPKNEVIEDEKFWMGYFSIITSEEMTAKEAIYLYKGRDVSEKLFLTDKSFLGNNTYRVETQESKDAKEWIGFVAEIIRNKIYTYLIDEQEKMDSKSNLLTVPAALGELEKYEICQQLTGGYHVHHALTKIQKIILSALHISVKEAEEEAEKICKALNI